MLCYKEQQVCLEKKKYHVRGKKAEVIWNFIGTPPLVWGNTSTSIGRVKKRWRIQRSAVQQKKVILRYFYQFVVVSFFFTVYQATYNIAERSER